jgi:hypothetical protein
MPTTYRIHPGIGIARLGNSPDAFCISPEKPAALPIACDSDGNPDLSPDGTQEMPVVKFKDSQGRLKRQAARFQIFVYDEQTPEGRPLKIGDPVSGGGNNGTLVDIQWMVYLANKKASWYQFEQLDGEHGYSADHPLRNPTITGQDARSRLIIDPGPRFVDCTARRRDHFDRDGGGIFAATFPPELKPNSIDTLGEILTDDTGRLLVLGGHGNSGTFNDADFGQPRIDNYANNDGWFDDTSDGPVMARLVMHSAEVGRLRFVDVEYPAWVVAGYPAYVPEILDMITTNEVIEDMGVRKFATRTDIYGTLGSFDAPPKIDPRDRAALLHWQAGNLQWNPDYKPWFYRDIWPILYRPDQYSYLCDVLGQSNFPHNQSARGNFDPYKLSVPPFVNREAVKACEQACIAKHQSGELFIETLFPVLEVVEQRVIAELAGADSVRGMLTRNYAGDLKPAVAAFAAKTLKAAKTGDMATYAEGVAVARDGSDFQASRAGLEHAIEEILKGIRERVSPEIWKKLRAATFEHLHKYLSGTLLEECRKKCVAANTHDPFGNLRRYLYEVLRQPGEENLFRAGGRADSRIHGLPLMPLLAGDNPISNVLPSKFLCLTDLQLYLLRQWAAGTFYNEETEGWAKPDPWHPYKDWVNRTGRDLDQGVLSNLAGGAFCPGAEIGWIQRNPAAYVVPYRIKADPAFYNFQQTAAQENTSSGSVPNAAYAAFEGGPLSQDTNFDVGLQPGDLTKYMALPWQADFNECYTQNINVTYDEWNRIDSTGNSLQEREQKVWETMWWPAHRPLQTYEVQAVVDGSPSYAWLDWARGIQQTHAGDLKMVGDWWRLGIVVHNPYLGSAPYQPTENPPDQKYISVERTEH